MTKGEASRSGGLANESKERGCGIAPAPSADQSHLATMRSDPSQSAARLTQPSHWRVPLVAGSILVAVLAGFGLWHIASEQVGPQLDPTILETETLLDQLGFSPGAIDGVADDDTAAAIRAYQQAADLPVDGRATPALLEELRTVAASLPAGQ